MAEYCLDCFNQLHNTAYKARRVTLEKDFCEGCAQVKLCVALLRPEGPFSRIAKRFRTLRRTRSGHSVIQRKGGTFKVTRMGRLIAVERQPMNIQSAYIRVYRAAAAALDELERLPQHPALPEVAAARRILAKAIADTEEHTEIV